MSLATVTKASAALLALAVVAGTVLAALHVTEPSWLPLLVSALLGHTVTIGAIAGATPTTPAAPPPAAGAAAGAAPAPAAPVGAGAGPLTGGS